LSPPSPINFVTPGPIGSADIIVNDAVKFQTIAGFGGSLSKSVNRCAVVVTSIALSNPHFLADSSALVLNNLKVDGTKHLFDCAYSFL
jgi:O-glycosyl hydrolase